MLVQSEHLTMDIKVLAFYFWNRLPNPANVPLETAFPGLQRLQYEGELPRRLLCRAIFCTIDAKIQQLDFKIEQICNNIYFYFCS